MEKYREIKKTINKIIREKKRFPSLQEMCNILHYTEEQTKKYMEALAEDGYLEKIGDWYKYPEEELQIPDKFWEEQPDPKLIVTKDGIVDKIAKEVNFPKENIVKTLKNAHEKTAKSTLHFGPPREEINEINKDIIENKPLIISKKEKKILEKSLNNKKLLRKTFDSFKKNLPKKKSKSKQKYSAPIYIIQILMGIIGMGASIISIYYTTVWLLEFLPWAFALLLSSIMVGFAVSAFETVILFLSGQVTHSKIAQWSITIGFIILWISVTFFSIFSTIAGQYNKFIANLQEEAKQGMDTGKMNWNSLQEEKQDLRTRLKEYRENVKTYTEISRTMTDLENRTENNKTWAENQYRLRIANEEIRKLLDELNKIREEERGLLKESKEKGIILGVTVDTENIVNFYGWIAKVLNIDKDRAQFFMSLLPAVFVDFISPTAIALALFLRSRYKT